MSSLHSQDNSQGVICRWSKVALFAFWTMFQGPQSHAGEVIEVFALQQENEILFRVENATGKVVYLGDPKESGVTVRVKSDLMDGELSSSVRMSPEPWKIMILLSGKEEDRPDLWSHAFSLTADRNKVGRITEMEVIMWVTTEDEYLKSVRGSPKGEIIPQVRQVRCDVKLSGVGRKEKRLEYPEFVDKNPSLKLVRVDGLPLKLGNASLMKSPELDKGGYLDLTEAFKQMGIGISEGEFVHYDPRTGFLIQRLSPAALAKVEYAIGEIYRSERRQAIARAYLFLLKNRENKERIELVMKTGFPPDPIITALILEIHSLESPGDGRGNEADPFDQSPPPASGIQSKPDQEKITKLRSRLDKLLTISLKRLEEQLAVLDGSDP